MCISNVKVEDQTQTLGALISITPQPKGKRFTNFSKNTTFCFNSTLCKWNHTLSIIFYLTSSAQIPLPKFLHIIAIVKDFNEIFCENRIMVQKKAELIFIAIATGIKL